MAKKRIKLELRDETVFSRNEEDFLFTEVDGEAVLMNTHTGEYFGFNPTMTSIWNLLAEDKSLRSIIDDLLEMYEVEEEVCTTETKQAMAGLLNLRAVSIQN